MPLICGIPSAVRPLAVTNAKAAVTTAAVEGSTMGKFSLRHLRYDQKTNYRTNAVLTKEPSFFQGFAFSGDGFLEHQNALFRLRCGARSAAYCGCGWIAVWNLFRSGGVLLPIPELIRDFERGLFVRGVFGTNPFFVRKFLKKAGFSVSLFLCEKKLIKKSPEKGILFFMRPDLSAHYVAFTAAGNSDSGERLYRFYNYGEPVPYIRTMTAFLAHQPHRMTLFFLVE